MTDKIKISDGAGGQKMDRLIKERILKYFKNDSNSEIPLSMLDDSAVIDDIVFSTDSHTVQPIIFPGGDIGSLAVCGTINDVAVMGAKPIALSTGFIVRGKSFSVHHKAFWMVCGVNLEVNFCACVFNTKN